jgi:hypothetical protein
MAELFGPCSLVWRSLMSSILASIVEACTPTDSLVCEDTSSIIGEKTTDQPISETSGVQLIERPLLDVVTPVEDIVLVEDASDDEKVVSQVVVEDPIYLITIEDDPAHCTTKVTTEVS